MNENISQRWSRWLVCLLLAVVTVAAYAPLRENGFINLDDLDYVTQNSHVLGGVTPDAVHWAFHSFHSSNWHPLTWLSHALDCQWFGLQPAGHHLVSLAFHVANTLLLFLLLLQLAARLWPAAFVALLFALHPMHVESVAWVSERKDVLSAFFFLLTLLAYARYVQGKSGTLTTANCQLPTDGEFEIRNSKFKTLFRSPPSWCFYLLALVLFALGLMSKPMLVTLPFVLLLLDFWPLNRFSFLPSASSGSIPSLSANEVGGEGRGEVVRDSQSPLRPLTSGFDTANCQLTSPPVSSLVPGGASVPASRHLIRNLKFEIRNFLPSDLWFFLLEKLPFFLLTALSCWVTFLAQKLGDSVKAVAEYSVGARLDHSAISYVWYLGKLFWPVDLSIYYPLHHSAFLASDTNTEVFWLLLAVVTALALWQWRRLPALFVGWFWFLGMLVPVIGLVQVGNQAYADRYTYLPAIGLFLIVAYGLPVLLARVPWRNFMLTAAAVLVAGLCFRLTAAQVRLWKDATTLFQHALALDEDNEEALGLLGLQEMNLGNSDKAVEYLRRATASNCAYFYAWNDLGRILTIKGKYDEAESAFLMAVLYAHDKTVPYNYLGDLYATTGRVPEAITNFQYSLALKPGQPDVHAALGRAFASIHQPDPAVAEFETALRADPGNGTANLGLAMILAERGQPESAIQHYRQAILVESNTVIALNNYAWLLAAAPEARLRNGPEAVRLAERACQLSHYQEPFLIGTLAAAYAEAGRFADAVIAATRARDLAHARGQDGIAASNDHLLTLYQSGRPFHEDPRPSPAPQSH